MTTSRCVSRTEVHLDGGEVIHVSMYEVDPLFECHSCGTYEELMHLWLYRKFVGFQSHVFCGECHLERLMFELGTGKVEL